MQKILFFLVVCHVSLLATGSEARSRFRLIEDDDYLSPLWGYQVRLGLGRPMFHNSGDAYDKLYGSSSFFPEASVGYYFNSAFINLGFALKIGVYSDTGKPSKEKNRAVPVDGDDDTTTSLSLMPIQFLFETDLKPIGRYFQIKGWLGIEELWVQEDWIEGSDLVSDGDDEETEKSLGNHGFNSSLVIGVGLKVLISQYDSTSALSMRQMLGLGRIYVMPFYEMKINMDAEEKSILLRRKVIKADYSSNTIGLSFSFES